MKVPRLRVGDSGDEVAHLHEMLKLQGMEVSPEEQKRKFFGPATRETVGAFQRAHGVDPSCELCEATATLLAGQPASATPRSAKLTPAPLFVPGAGVSPIGTPTIPAAQPLPAIGGTVPEAATGPHQVEGRIFFDHGLPAGGVALRAYSIGFGGADTRLGDITTDEQGSYVLPYDPGGKAVNLEVRMVDAEGKETPLSSAKFNAGKHEVMNLVAPVSMRSQPHDVMNIVAPASIRSQASEFHLMANDLVGPVGGDLSKLALAKETDEFPDLSLLHENTGWDARLIAKAAIAAKVNSVTGIAHDALYGAFRAGLPDDPEALAMVSTEAFATALTRAQDAGVIALDEAQVVAANTAFTNFKLDTLRKAVMPGALSSIGDMLDKAKVETEHKVTFENLVLLHDGDDAELWKEAKAQGIPDAQIASLQFQGKLAYLTLNNAPLAEVLQTEITSQDNLREMVEKDLYRKEEWVARLKALAGDDNSTQDNLAKLIPPAYAHPEVNDRLDAYAEDLARKVRQSYPTHVINRRLAHDELTLGVQHAEMKAPVQTLLTNAVDKGFQLGRTPVDQFLMQHGATVFEGIEDKKGLAEEGVKVLTRAYQMTPNDEAMTTLLALGFTSAQQVVAISEAEFVDRYWKHFGSRKITKTVYDKSVQISSVTYNIYTLGKIMDSAPPIDAVSGSREKHKEAKDKLKSLLKEYPTMESLFGSLDFCECEHCRSVLSPAAYLVDLLRFIDPPKQDWEHNLEYWKETHNQREYTKDPYNYLKPYDALILRRPDLPHLPLTCENTNTALPYIDLVNEILEYFVANTSLDADAAHDTGEATSAELMAEPHNIIPKAYDTLKGARYPLALPFDLWLEMVRRFCEYFETPLWQVLDVFRPSDDLLAPATDPAPYYRAQIFAEYLGLSPDEYAIYTAPALADWPKLYGYDKAGDSESSALASLKSAKTLSRRLGVSYKELTELVTTGFVNPKLNTLVTLRKLGVDVGDVFRFKKHAKYAPFTPEEEAEFEKRLQQLTEKFKPNFDAKQWLNDSWDQQKFEKVLVLRDPDAGCSFDETSLLYADGMDVEALEFVKMNLFLRLWKRLGWTMEETDRALQAFLPANVDISDATLGNAMKTALVYLAHLKELSGLLNVGKNSLMKLLTLWADLPTAGKNSLYAQLFLTRNILKDDAIFDDPLGAYLSKPGVPLRDHLPALQAALNLTADEITQVLQDGNTGDESDINKAMLSLANVSLLYRYGLLAKALKLSIEELVILKALSGLNPFHALSPDALDEIKNDFPLNQTLEFVRRAQQVKASALAINDLDYLLRHRFDPLGKYRENSDAKLAWIRTLAAQLRTIAGDYAVPTDADSVSDDALRQKMSLVFAPDVVEMFMAFWLDKAVYSATKAPVPPDKRIPPAQYGVDGVSVSYDETLQRQQVTYVGVLTGAEKTTRLNRIPQPSPADQSALEARQNFSDLLDELVMKSSVQFKQFFGDHFDGLLQFDDFFGAGVNATTAGKRLSLLKKLLPFLQAKLTRMTILQAMTTQTGGDAALIETLLTNSDFLALPDANTQSLMDRFEGLGQYGLTAELFALGDLKEPYTPRTVQDIEVSASANINSARWRGYLEVPQSGAYRFYAKLGKKDAAIDLRFDAASESFLNGQAAKDGDELSGSIELKAGVLYALTLEATNLQNSSVELLFKGETTPKNKLSQFVALPHNAVSVTTHAYTMLAKALQLVQGLGLSEHDVRHILAHPSDFAGVNWRLLPTQETTSTDANAANAVALFNAATRLMNYTALKRDLAGGGDDLIAIFERARLKNPESVVDLCKQIATMTRRKLDVVQSTATELGMTAPEHFADEARMERLWAALKIVEKFGVQVASLKKWLTPTPDANVAMDVRNTVKARYEPETWQRLAKAIFDPLRQRQRDALVAHILHKEEFESIEKLFEFFLIDPGMEPVVQTSRLRLAISSLQTFIQRCFLNLEPRVHPSMLNAQHWAWMKRYRVWEANRKIFLFPENWLEPEWRDDKTHLYQELESSLLQGDVTNQLAEDALYVYLKKLDQLARLEIVTMYAEEDPLGPPTMHVIGRTYGLPRQYFYRRYARQMWTPWEPVTTEIDGDHIVAVMWRERLHLFWLTFMEKVEKVEESASGPQTGGETPLRELPVSDLVSMAVATSKGAVHRSLDVQLNWSEYFQGEWTVRESSGFGNIIDRVVLSGPFDASKVFVTVSKSKIPDSETDTDSIVINLLGYAFHLVSKNSRPQLSYVMGAPPGSPYFELFTLTPQGWKLKAPEKTFNRFKGSGALSVTFAQEIVTTDGVTVGPPQRTTLPILARGRNRGYTLLPTSNQMKLPNWEFAPLISPVFYADDVYTFFVEPSLTETTMDKWEGYTITRRSQKQIWEDFVNEGPKPGAMIPPKYLQEALKPPTDNPQPAPIDPRALHTLKPNQDVLTQPNAVVPFGGALIGVTGRVQDLGGAGIPLISNRVGENF